MFRSREEWPAPAPSSAIIMAGGRKCTMNIPSFHAERSGLHPVTLVESHMKRTWMNVFVFVKRRRIEAEVEEVSPLNLCYAARLIWWLEISCAFVTSGCLSDYSCYDHDSVTMAWHAKIYYDNEVYFLFCFCCFISLLCPRLVCRRAKYLAREGGVNTIEILMDI